MGSLSTVSDDNGSDQSSGTAPKLTMGQRLLTSLPDLQRKPKAPAKVDTTSDGADDASPSDNGTGPEADGGGTASSTKAPPRGKTSGLSKEELTHAIKRIDDRERLLAILSAPIGVVVGALLTVLAVHFNPPLHHKNHLTFVTIVVFEGGARVLLSGVVLAAAYTRRRSFVGFALLFLGTSLGLPFALPFWALGAWLIWRVFKYQRELTALGGTVGRQRKPAAGRDSGRGTNKGTNRPATLAEARAAGAARSRRKKQLPTTGPPPSKRYTPPRPTRPKPPPPA